MRPSAQVEPSFFQYLLKCSAFIQTLQTAVTGIRDGKSVRYEQFADLVLPCPDLQTQKAIADFLDRETARIDAIKSKTAASIDRLREHRAALITAAVTGQIDVTTWQRRGHAERHLERIEERLVG
jgi:type I restriction enzyme S subunit